MTMKLRSTKDYLVDIFTKSTYNYEIIPHAKDNMSL